MIKRYQPDPQKPRQLTEEEAERLDRMTDDDLDYSDIPPLDDEFFAKAKQVLWPLPTKDDCP
ncbi:MAG: hypothetical protein JO069_18875 [Verrucomicrobia bacterium]|nr:hypothetical protein [Verrucomicrobiota bacterium]